MNYLKLSVIGRLGTNPKTKDKKGHVVTTFSVAINRKYYGSKGNLVEELIWLKVTAYGRNAKLCYDYLKKGDLVHFEGRLAPDKNGSPHVYKIDSGEYRANYDIDLEHVTILDNDAKKMRSRK